MHTTETIIAATDFGTFTTAVVAFTTYLMGVPTDPRYRAAFAIPRAPGADLSPQPIIDILHQLPGLIITTVETADVAQRSRVLVQEHAPLLADGPLEHAISAALVEVMRGPELPAAPHDQPSPTLRDIAQDFFMRHLGLFDEVPRLQQIADALEGATLDSRRTILTAAMLTLAADEQDAIDEAAAEEAAERAMNDD